MSDTKKKSNAAIACGDMKFNADGRSIILDQGNYGPSRDDINQLAGMEIEFGDDKECIITNETSDGKTAVIDPKTGDIIGYLDSDGTLNRKLANIDKENAREQEDMEK